MYSFLTGGAGAFTAAYTASLVVPSKASSRFLTSFFCRSWVSVSITLPDAVTTRFSPSGTKRPGPSPLRSYPGVSLSAPLYPERSSPACSYLVCSYPASASSSCPYPNGTSPVQSSSRNSSSAQSSSSIPSSVGAFAPSVIPSFWDGSGRPSASSRAKALPPGSSPLPSRSADSSDTDRLSLPPTPLAVWP